MSTKANTQKGLTLGPAQPLEELQEQLDAAREALRKFGSHQLGCAVFSSNHGKCTCGWRDAIEANKLGRTDG